VTPTPHDIGAQVEQTAHTLPYDIAAVTALQRGTPLPSDRRASVTQPALVMAGGRSPAWLRTAMRSLADALADSRHLVLERQMHIVDGACRRSAAERVLP
jgi:hypothetical protein